MVFEGRQKLSGQVEQRQMSPCASSDAPPPPTKKSKQQLRILAGAAGHPWEHDTTAQAIPLHGPVGHDVRSGPVSPSPELRLF